MPVLDLDAPSRSLSQPIEAILEWHDDEIVRRYCIDHNASAADGDVCFEAFKQFMIICGSSRSVKAPSEAVDDMWHTALLFTRGYRDFCGHYLGVFIHHQPVEQKADVIVYDETRRLAETMFGTLDERCWPEADAVARCGGCGSIYVP
jgi:hypothetical protein